MKSASENLSDHPFCMVIKYVSPRWGVSIAGSSYETKAEAEAWLEDVKNKGKVLEYRLYGPILCVS